MDVKKMFFEKMVMLEADDPIERAVLQVADILADELHVDGPVFIDLVEAVKVEVGLLPW